jgi:membrane-associated protein
MLDFLMHIEQWLPSLLDNYGLWIYAILFLIIFAETGSVFMFFLPGDSLLLAIGALC